MAKQLVCLQISFSNLCNDLSNNLHYVFLVPLDLAFLVDGATKVEPGNFKLMIMLIKLIYHVLPISSDGVHVGMVTYGDVGKLVFNFLQHKTIKSLDMAVDQLTLPGGNKNNVGAGLATTLSQIFSTSGRKGEEVKKAVVTFLVGKPDDDPTIYSNTMKSENIVSIVIAIYSDMTHASLIASSPDHVLLINNVMELLDNVDKIIEMMNKGKYFNMLYNSLYTYHAPSTERLRMGSRTNDYLFRYSWWTRS